MAATEKLSIIAGHQKVLCIAVDPSNPDYLGIAFRPRVLAPTPHHLKAGPGIDCQVAGSESAVSRSNRQIRAREGNSGNIPVFWPSFQDLARVGVDCEQIGQNEVSGKCEERYVSRSFSTMVPNNFAGFAIQSSQAFPVFPVSKQNVRPYGNPFI